MPRLAHVILEINWARLTGRRAARRLGARTCWIAGDFFVPMGGCAGQEGIEGAVRGPLRELVCTKIGVRLEHHPDPLFG